jgi:hypothetical protein
MFLYASALPFNVQLNYDRNYDTSLNDRPYGVGRSTARGFDYASLDIRQTRPVPHYRALGAAGTG